jgi:hypothetical protein
VKEKGQASNNFTNVVAGFLCCEKGIWTTHFSTHSFSSHSTHSYHIEGQKQISLFLVFFVLLVWLVVDAAAGLPWLAGRLLLEL